MNSNDFKDFFADDVIKNLNLPVSNANKDTTKCIDALYVESLEERIVGMKNVVSEISPVLSEEGIQYLLKHLIPCANTIVDRTFEKALENMNLEIEDSTTVLETAKKYLQMSVDTIKVIDDVMEYIITNKINMITLLKTLPLNVVEILFKIFTHCKESQTIYKDYFDSLNEIINLFRKGQEVNSKFLRILESQLLYDNLTYEDTDILTKVLETLGKVGEILAGMNLKAMMGTWKGYINLLQNHLNNAEKSKISSAQPLLFFSTEVKNNISNILESDQDNKNVQQTLKITKFLVKIACHICSSLKTEQSYKDTIMFLTVMYNFSPPVLEQNGCSSDIVSLITSCIFEPCDRLCQKLIMENDFHETLLSIDFLKTFINDDNVLGFVLLLFHVLEQNNSLYKKDEDNSAFDLCKYFEVIFFVTEIAYIALFYNVTIPFKCGVSSNLFDAIVIKCVLLLSLMNLNQLHKSETILLRNILDSNVWTVLLATEIWTCFMRFQSSDYRYDLLCNLVEGSSVIFGTIFSLRPEIVALGNLVSRIYHSLPVNYKAKFAEKFFPCDYVHIWKYIGLRSVSNLNIIDSLIVTFTEKTDMFYSGKLVPQDFIYLCNVCELLSSAEFEECNIDTTFLKTQIIKLWNIDAEDQELFSFPCFRIFLDKLCKITSILMGKLGCEDIFTILHQLKILSDTGFNLIYCILKLIDSISSTHFQVIQNEAIDIIVDFFIKGLTDRNPIIRQESLERFVSYFRKTPHKELTFHCLSSKNENLLKNVKEFFQHKIEVEDFKSKEYFENQKNNMFIHSCLEWPQRVVQQSKKLKTDVNEIISMVKRIEDDVGALKKCRQSQQLSDETVARLVHISSEIQQLIS